MKHSAIKIKNLTTYEECDKAIHAIEMDYDNTKGGYKAFFSGYTTALTEGAKKKIEMIERRQTAICKAHSDY